VRAAQSDARRRRDTGHVDGGVALRDGPVPELAVVVAPAALDRATRQQGTRVVLAQSDTRRRRDPGHFDRGGASSGGPVPELALLGPAPALDRAVR